MDPVLAAAVVTGLLFRLLVWKYSRWMIGFDEANYLRLAGHALETDLSALLHPYWPPFYPFGVCCLSPLFHNIETAARWVNVLAGTGLIPLMYAWSRRLSGPVSARLTAWMLALYPPLAFDSTAAMPEAVYTLAALSGMLLGWRALNRREWSGGLAAGLCWAAAYLSKPEGIGFLLIFILFSLIWAIGRKDRAARVKTAICAISAIAGFLILASPYLLFLKQSTGEWTISTKGMINQQMRAAVVFNDGPVRDPFFHVTADNRHLPYDMGLHFGNIHELKSLSGGRERFVSISLRKHAVKIVRNLYQLIKETLPQLFGIGLMLFFTLGFFSTHDHFRKWPVFYLFLFIGAYWFGMVPLFHVNSRYLMPLFPVFFIWMGRGGRALYERIREFPAGKRGLSSRISVVIAALFYLGPVFLIEMGPVAGQSKPGSAMWDPPLELKAAALWLESRSEDPPRMMTLNKAVDFYAGQYDITQGASFSYDSIEKNLAYAKHRGCEYLVFTSRYLPWFENLKPLVGPVDPPGITRIYDAAGDENIRAVIYRIEDPE